MNDAALRLAETAADSKYDVGSAADETKRGQRRRPETKGEQRLRKQQQEAAAMRMDEQLGFYHRTAEGKVVTQAPAKVFKLVSQYQALMEETKEVL